MTAPIQVAVVEDRSESRQSLMILIDGSASFACRQGYPTAEAAHTPV